MGLFSRPLNCELALQSGTCDPWMVIGPASCAFDSLREPSGFRRSYPPRAALPQMMNGDVMWARSWIDAAALAVAVTVGWPMIAPKYVFLVWATPTRTPSALFAALCDVHGPRS